LTAFDPLETSRRSAFRPHLPGIPKLSRALFLGRDWHLKRGRLRRCRHGATRSSVAQFLDEPGCPLPHAGGDALPGQRSFASHAFRAAGGRCRHSGRPTWCPTVSPTLRRQQRFFSGYSRPVSRPMGSVARPTLMALRRLGGHSPAPTDWRAQFSHRSLRVKTEKTLFAPARPCRSTIARLIATLSRRVEPIQSGRRQCCERFGAKSPKGVIGRLSPNCGLWADSRLKGWTR